MFFYLFPEPNSDPLTKEELEQIQKFPKEGNI